MIEREFTSFLERWKTSPSRLPLIIRGARQVGKTTVVNQFGNGYDQYLYFNLEKNTDATHFQKIEVDLSNTINLLFVVRQSVLDPAISTLLFIDEVQENPKVIEQLRYIHEQFPYLHIIVTGSLLEFALKSITKIPVGRVEFAEVKPLSFVEYLKAQHKNQLISLMKETMPINILYHEVLINEFNKYAMIGGMPKIVEVFIQEGNYTRLREHYYALTEAYKSDVIKYARNLNEATIIRNLLEIAPYEIDNRINFSNFSNLPYKAIEIKNCLSTLEFARVLKINYPTLSTIPPVIQDLNKRPRLHFLDIGLINFLLGLSTEYLTIDNLHSLSKGKLVQQVVVQELNSFDHLHSHNYTFWVREERGSTSEVDIIFPYKQILVPIEVKAGASGTLRSLHEFMDRVDHTIAVRIYSGKLSIETMSTRKGKSYQLLNLPYYLTSQLNKYLNWALENTSSKKEVNLEL
jgi:uncharacterized protein